MSAAPATPAPVKFVVGLLAGRVEWLDAIAIRMREAYGPTDVVSEVWPFDFSDYYASQMGSGLLRQFLAFEQLVDPSELATIKLATNAIEGDFAAATDGPDRPVNIDPGYVAEAKLVLASCKDYAHRVYLGGGVFAEVTLRYVGGVWQGHDCTFPDYASGRYDAFLAAARVALRGQLDRKESGS